MDNGGQKREWNTEDIQNICRLADCLSYLVLQKRFLNNQEEKVTVQEIIEA